MRKKISLLLLSFGIVMSLLMAANINGKTKALDNQEQKDGPEQNSYYTIIDENGNVTFYDYEEEDEIQSVKSNDYKVVKTLGNDSYDVKTFDTLEEAQSSMQHFQMYRSPAQYDVEAIADTKSINYGVARLIGYITYKEYDGTGKGRTGYTHGSSANDAAYISTSNDGKTIRVKQAGVIMDIPAEKVEVTEYTSNSKVSYYMGKGGKLYHYYYTGAYGGPTKLGSTQVGYTPTYINDDVKYYSYDGHYFYTDYVKMLKDYSKDVNCFVNAVNPNSPYYNYYQYLSLRTSSKFTASDFNKLIIDEKGNNTSSKLKDQGQALINSANKSGINASLMFGVAINESGWGLSKYSQERNNLFGIGAADSNTDNAYRYDTVEDCFNYFSHNLISSQYLNGLNWKYRGSHLGDKQSGINVKYASDPYWGEKAASFSYILNKNTENKDYEKYQIAIAKTGKLTFYKNEGPSTVIYDSTAYDSTNDNVYNTPVAILSTNANSYKILSDTVLNDNRTGQNASAYFNLNRDYVFVKKSDVSLRNTTSSNIPDPTPSPIYNKGDINGDGKIDSMDMYYITQHILGKKNFNDAEFAAADTNKDNKIDSMDMYNVIQIILKK